MVHGAHGVEEALVHGEERQVLDVGVALHRVGNDVVDVVALLPPPDADAAEQIAHLTMRLTDG